MKRSISLFLGLLLLTLPSPILFSQKNTPGIDQIKSSDLESYVTFLASPLLKGRMNGQEGLDIAAQFIASQAKLLGLKPANNNSYFQPYPILTKSLDPNKSGIRITSGSKDTVITEPMFQLIPTGPSDFILDGEVVFAGYGIKADKYNYNDFDNLRTEGKILLVMDRAPMSEDGKTSLFEEPDWSSASSFQMKLTTLILSRAKAILIVSDPKSGFQSFEESSPGLANYLKSKVTLKGEMEEYVSPFMDGMPKVIFIHRSIADVLMKGTGHSLEELQKSIDTTLKPHSFSIEDKILKITEVSVTEEKVLNNVAGYIEGTDPILKNEIVIFSAHYDHIGVSGNGVNAGADDDASGCAALLSMAEGFLSLRKKPLRTILFLWVSGEEIGLYGSKSYVDNPLFPLDKTVVDLNMDMIGRVKGVADTSDNNPMTGPNSVFVITGSQSKELLTIADEIDKETVLDFDYSLSGIDHPLQLLTRSDHYNFVENDIPVLFFTTGLHTDYHTPGDIVDKIDFNKLEIVTQTMYKIGLNVANRNMRILVDNPFSSWGKTNKP